MHQLTTGAGRLRCPVCGTHELTVPPYADYDGTVPPSATPPYEDELGRASYEVCPCCGFEFGFDDNPGGDLTGESFDTFRQHWERKGRPRFSERTH